MIRVYKRWAAMALVGLIVVMLNAVLFGINAFVIAWSWNTLFAEHFGLATISFGQGVAITVFVSMFYSALVFLFGRTKNDA